MKIAYLILAHEHPAQVARLIGALRTAEVRFFVHIDAKASIEAFGVCAAGDVVFCTRRVDCAWGNISLVDATLSLMREALAAPRACDRYVLISGACYPIQPPPYISAFFSSNRSVEFIECFDFPDPDFGKPIERVEGYWIKRQRPLLGLKWMLQKALLRYAPRRDYRAATSDLELVVGSQWWALTHDAVDYVVRFVDGHPRFYRFCAHIDCPDELVIQTIIYNSRFRCSVSHSLTYTRWSPGRTGPDFIDAAMLDSFRAMRVLAAADNNSPGEKRETLFARKVDSSTRTGDMLDRLIADKITRADTDDCFSPDAL